MRSKAPEVQLVAITMADGTVQVMQFVLCDHRSGWRREATDFNIREEIERTAFEQPVKSWRRIDRADLPTDRTFRDAWRDEGGKLSVDMTRARELHRDRIRTARAPMLDALDVEYQRADETVSGTRKKTVAARKQALRDAPADPRIDAAQTPDELKAVWPL